MENVSGQNLQQFFKQWLYTAGHPELGIVWNYDVDKQHINFRIDQKQSELYEFTLEYAVDGKLKAIEIKDRTTTIPVPAKTKPLSIIIDPDVNLLGRFDVKF